MTLMCGGRGQIFSLLFSHNYCILYIIMEKEIAIFKTEKETINVEVLFEDETVWLTQEQMAQLFEKSK